MDKLKRYIIFLIGLFINSLGVSLITKAALGTSPISSIPYVLSLIFPFTLGQFTIYFSVLLVVLQLLILRRKFKVEHLLQIPISIAFGYFINPQLCHRRQSSRLCASRRSKLFENLSSCRCKRQNSAY